ncbi:unnamed protein product, partial [Ectocarpus sp. 12 AP-2014]
MGLSGRGEGRFRHCDHGRQVFFDREGSAVGPLAVRQHPKVPAVPAYRQRGGLDAETFLSAVSRYEPPLNAVMMLWVNLIMDTM